MKLASISLRKAMITAILLAGVVAAWIRVPYLRIPYYHSFARQETRYLLVYRHGNGLPSQVARVMVDSVYPGGAFFGNAYIFPGGWKCEVQHFGPSAHRKTP